MTHPKIFCAVDTNDFDRARDIIAALDGECGVKLGLEFFNAFGASGVKTLMNECGNPPLFLDLKYHDIPNTVAGAVGAVGAQLTPAFLNVHATGGMEMMKAAKAACPPDTKLLAVTVLTSIDTETLNSVGQGDNTADQVVRLAKLTQNAGLDGVVCSSHEIALIRAACGDDFITMVPGIRPAGSDKGDQKRVMTPKDAVDQGATHMVIGRPITQADIPAQAVKDILKSLEE